MSLPVLHLNQLILGWIDSHYGAARLFLSSQDIGFGGYSLHVIAMRHINIDFSDRAIADPAPLCLE